MAAVALKLMGPLQQPGGGFGEIRAIVQPGLFGQREIPEACQPLEGCGSCGRAAAQFQHRQGLIEGRMQ